MVRRNHTDKLTPAYLDARYFERNVAVVQVLLDRAAIEKRICR
jgi:hypothetical protein